MIIFIMNKEDNLEILKKLEKFKNQALWSLRIIDDEEVVSITIKRKVNKGL